MSLVTVSPVITTFHSCCLSHHVFDQVNLWPAWVGFETAIFWQCSPGTIETQRLYPLHQTYFSNDVLILSHIFTSSKLFVRLFENIPNILIIMGITLLLYFTNFVSSKEKQIFSSFSISASSIWSFEIVDFEVETWNIMNLLCTLNKDKYWEQNLSQSLKKTTGFLLSRLWKFNWN